ncbi:uncharacterized protein PFL1_00399 [Pseudozyma flocculosa PF-1]|uniref:Extracellular membrane protein CFEM domain-containing protein n=1 Tax=Pseudozyma flocculosa TaxID=84751 RepID=A0A5C3ER82_9BASI|nr:uncharacterized protein PFL1_00399 [Pseudozyma flocculosa PF-1]EPQ32202.1 hypothetical protein PFL1_00399 [Pseudozyma flocculosa PF-1]SPO34854.1 uncharacterized protein PSFLO_00325 [Pseudozyma flocculosa]
MKTFAALSALLLAAQQASADLLAFDKFGEFRSLVASPSQDAVNATSLIAFFSEHKTAPALEARQASAVSASSSAAPSRAAGTTKCASDDCTSSYDLYKSCPDTTYAFLSCFCADKALEMARCYDGGCGIESAAGTDVTMFVLEACILYMSNDRTTASECLLSRNGYSTACRKSLQYSGGSSGGIGDAVSGSATAAWSASATASRSGSATATGSSAPSPTFYVPTSGSSGGGSAGGDGSGGGNGNGNGGQGGSAASFIPQPSQSASSQGAPNAATRCSATALAAGAAAVAIVVFAAI